MTYYGDQTYIFTPREPSPCWKKKKQHKVDSRGKKLQNASRGTERHSRTDVVHE